jgi:fibronectin-binding autotransporter adhesin
MIAAAGLFTLSLGWKSLPAQSTSATWSGAGPSATATWTNGSNWVGGSYAGSTTAGSNSFIATFSGPVGAFGDSLNPIALPTTGTNIFASQLVFDFNAGSYTIGTTGGDALGIYNGVISGYASGTSGGNLFNDTTETINAPIFVAPAVTSGGISLTSDANNNNFSAGTLLFGGRIAGYAGTPNLTLTGNDTNFNAVGGIIANFYPGASSGATLEVTKSGFGTWVLSGANTFTNVVADTKGTLVAESASALGAGTGVTVGQGAALEYFAQTDAALSYTTGTLGITTGTVALVADTAHSLYYGLRTTTIGGSIGATTTSSQMNFGANNIVVTAGTGSTVPVNVNIYGESNSALTSGSGTYVLLSGTGASSNLNSVNYSLGAVYDNTNFTVSGVSATQTQLLASITSQTALSGNVYWSGGLSNLTNMPGAINAWAISNGTSASNWSTSLGGTSQALIPGAGTTLHFDGGGLTAANTTLGAKMSVVGIVVGDSVHGLGLNTDGNTLTLGTGGITVGYGVPQAQFGSNIVLNGAQTWANNSSNAPLDVFGLVSGTGALTTGGTGVTILADGNSYNGGTTVSSGKLQAENANALGSGNVTVQKGAALNYQASADSPLTIGGTVTINSGTLAGGPTTAIGGSIGSTTTSSQINVTGNATATAGAVNVNVYGENGVSPASGTYVLVQGNGGSNSLNTATYALGTVYDNTNFTVSGVSATAGQIDAAIASATALSGNVYWVGGLAGNSNVWAASNGSTASNWATSAGGSSQALVPGAGTTLNFTTSEANAANNSVLGANMSVGGVVIGDTNHGVSIYSDGNTLTVGSGGITVNSSVPLSTIGANVSLNGNQTWTDNSSNPLVVTGDISGTGSLTIAGTGQIVLTGVDSYTGGTTVNSGTLTAENAYAIGGGTLTIANGAAFNYDAQTDSQLYISGNMTIAGAPTGVAKAVIGTSIGSTPTSAEIVVGGTASVTGAGTGTAQSVLVNVFGNYNITPASGTYTLIQVATYSGNITSNVSYAINHVYDNTNFTVSSPTTSGNPDFLFDVVTAATPLTTAYWIGGLSGANNVWAATNGSTASNWAQNVNDTLGTGLAPGPTTTVIISASSTKIAVAPTATVLGTNMSILGLDITDTKNGLGLNADGNTLTIGSGGINVGDGVPLANIGANVSLNGAQTWTNSDTTGTLNVTGAITGYGGLTIDGGGVNNFSAANTYTGGTTITSGTLVVSNTSGSAVGGGGVTVGGTPSAAGSQQTPVLAGTGIVAGPVVISSDNGNVGTIAPGPVSGTAPGTLTIAGNLTFEVGTNANFALGTSTALGASDLIAITSGGTLSIGSSITVNLSELGASFAQGSEYTLISGFTNNLSLSGITFTTTGNDGLNAAYTVVATGSTYALELMLGNAVTTPTVAYFNGATSDINTQGNFYSTPTGVAVSGPVGSTTDVFFTATSGNGSSVLTPTLNTGSVTVNSVTFTGSGTPATSGVNLSGTNTVTIAAGTGTYSSGTGIVVQAGSGANTISAPVALGASQSWSNNSGNLLTVSGGVSGTGNLNLQDNSTGGITISSGAVNPTGSITNTGSGSGTTTISANIGSAVTGVTENSGTSALVLSGSNTYSGPTTVTNGTLLINNGTGSALGTGSLAVARGATFGGSGSATSLSSVNIGGSGTGTSTLLVGNTLNTTTNLTLGASSITVANTTMDFNIKSGTGSGYAGGTTGQSNELVVGGSNVSFGSNLQLSITIQGEPSIIGGYTAYVLIAGTGSTNVSGGTSSGQYSGLTLGGLATVQPGTGTATLISNSDLALAFTSPTDQAFYGANSYVVIYQNGSVDDIDLVVVPEPGTWALILGGMGLLVLIQRNKRRRSTI